MRNGTFYAQLRADGQPTKVKLEHAETVPQAVEELQHLKKKRRAGELVVVKQRTVPTFRRAAADYMAELRSLAAKHADTIKRESSGADKLAEFMGDVPVNKITGKHAFDFAAWRMAGESGVSGRTVDVNIITLRWILRKAIRDGHLKALPFEKWAALADDPKQVRLIPTEQLDAMKQTSREHVGGGRQFADYLEVLAASGGREQETLRLQWSVNVNWDTRKLGFGQDGKSKKGRMRWVPFNARLEKMLKEMFERKKSDLLFPSPRVNTRPAAGMTSYKKALAALKRKMPGIDDVGFHHFRHYFISHCVMAGIDFKTIAEWVAHKDGGVLIGRVYSHLTNEHSEAQAKKLSF